MVYALLGVCALAFPPARIEKAGMANLAHRSVAALAKMIRDREISSRELLDHYLERVERFNGALNAVVTLDTERARQRAAAADAALARGESWGPLHGVPMTVKDSFETAGLRTTCGAPDLAEYVPQRNAAALQRLVDAGVVVFGKTNTPFMAGDVQTFNALFGTTNNPWNPQHTSGGSSGGAAVAVATGMTSFELGSDIGGSIRTPSNWCGVYGHKPTHGIVPQRGHIPGPPGTLSEGDLNVVGPLARTPSDLRLALDLLAGPLPDRGVAWQLHLPPPRRERLQDYRVATVFDDAAFPVDAPVRTVLEQTAAALRDAGANVRQVELPFKLDDLADTYFRILCPIIAAGFPPATFEGLAKAATQIPATERNMMARMARYGTGRSRDLFAASEAREHLRARFALLFEEVDVLLCPITPVAAIPHDQSEPMANRTIQVNGAPRSYQELFGWISMATLNLLPATAAPVGLTAAGLPVGVQIIGPYLEDRTTLDFACRLAEVVPGPGVPPGYRD